MYYFSKNYFDLFKISLLVFTFLFILFLFFCIFFPYEAFAMEPPNKNYYEYSKIIYNNLCSDKFTKEKIFINKDVKLTNPFNRLLFVVQDKKALLKNISDKGYIISQGPQQ
jgi:hypothetical protein